MNINYVLRLLDRQEQQINRDIHLLMGNTEVSNPDALLHSAGQLARAFSYREQIKLIHTIRDYIEDKLEEEEKAKHI